MAVLGEPQGEVDSTAQLVFCDVNIGELGFRPGDLSADLLLLLPGDVVRHRIAHRLLGPLVSSLLQLAQPGGETLPFIPGPHREAGEVSLELTAQVLETCRGDLLVPPGRGHLRFHLVGRQVRHVTVDPAVVLATAAEVLVLPAIAGRDEVQQP